MVFREEKRVRYLILFQAKGGTLAISLPGPNNCNSAALYYFIYISLVLFYTTILFYDLVVVFDSSLFKREGFPYSMIFQFVPLNKFNEVVRKASLTSLEITSLNNFLILVFNQIFADIKSFKLVLTVLAPA